jgi:hypothetical protein
MNIPTWLSKMTGAEAFATNPNNMFQPTLGDALQGIGHSMAEHYRRGQGAGMPSPLAGPQATTPAPEPVALPQIQRQPVAAPNPVEFTPTAAGLPLNLTLAQLLGNMR